MRISHQEFQSVEVEVADDVLCNNCGKSCCKGSEGHKRPHGLNEARVSGGYHSDALCDMTSYTFSLCEECLKAMFDKFAIKPLVHSDGEVIEYDPDWKEKAEASARAWQVKNREKIAPHLPKLLPAPWVRQNEGENEGDYGADVVFRRPDEGGFHVTVAFVGDDLLHVTVCRDMDVSRGPLEAVDRAITREEVEEARKIFAPWIEFDERLAHVRVMMGRDEATREKMVCVAFSKVVGQ